MRLLAFVLSALAVGGQPEGDASAERVHRSELLGYSVRGRPIRAVELGNPGSPTKILVVGCIHGNECAGIRVTRLLARGARPAFDLWVVHNLNPDGYARRTRQNARGVDLNRNFPAGWRPTGRRWDPTYPGPRPLSEPESRIARRLILRVRPDVTLWFHQPQALVRAWSGPSLVSARRYARLAEIRFRRLPVPPGAATRWQVRRFRGAAAFVVELPAGPLSQRAAMRYARAVRLLAR